MRLFWANDAHDMAVRPITLDALRSVADLAAGLVRSALSRKSLEELAAEAMVRAPNRGRSALAPKAGELRVRVGPPDAVLSVAIVEPAAPRATVFVLHGIRGSMETMRGWAKALAASGYRAVLVDLRGHGRSTGHTLTYGVHDARDLTLVLDALLEREPQLGPVGVMGHSYGAATAIQWAGSEPRVAAAVAVSPFASLRAVVPGYLPLSVPREFAERVVDAAGVLAGFDPDAASPLEAIARTRAPVLLVHGRQDARIPFSHSERLANSAGGLAELVIVDGARHDTVAGAAETRLAERAAAWFRTHLA